MDLKYGHNIYILQIFTYYKYLNYGLKLCVYITIYRREKTYYNFLFSIMIKLSAKELSAMLLARNGGQEMLDPNAQRAAQIFLEDHIRQSFKVIQKHLNFIIPFLLSYLDR